MKMKTLRFALLAALLGANGACVYIRSPVLNPPPIGTGFTNIGVPVDTTFDQTQMGGREGRSASYSMFGLFAWGDATVTSAAQKARIDVVEQVDCTIDIILFGLYAKYETIVTGH